jgi:serine/threonine-protein kinase
LSIKRFAVLSLKYGLLALALVLTATLSAVTTMRVVLLSQEVPVPPLEGRRVPEAGALAARHGLLVRVEGRRHDPRVARDRVALQEPAAGATLKRQRSIRVWLSLGPERLEVPAIEGQSVRTARLTLDQARVPVARVVEVDDPSPAGTVLAQTPAAGQTDSIGEGVSLLVSRGRPRPQYLMPDLIGRAAEGLLEELARHGLKVADVRERHYPGVPPGVVLRQAPAAGHPVNPAVAVSLEISQEPS